MNQPLFVSCLSYGSCDFMVELYSALGCCTFMEVMVMTDNFGNKIGESGSGMVYYGNLRTGQEVAMKVWVLRSHSAAKEFQEFVKVRSPIS